METVCEWRTLDVESVSAKVSIILAHVYMINNSGTVEGLPEDISEGWKAVQDYLDFAKLLQGYIEHGICIS